MAYVYMYVAIGVLQQQLPQNHGFYFLVACRSFWFHQKYSTTFTSQITLLYFPFQFHWYRSHHDDPLAKSSFQNNTNYFPLPFSLRFNWWRQLWFNPCGYFYLVPVFLFSTGFSSKEVMLSSLLALRVFW